MKKYKSDDYKLDAVKYYLKHNDSMNKVCKIFDCKKSTLKGWVDRYNTSKNLTRKNRNYKNYFQYAYGTKDDMTYKRKPSTRKCRLKNYKL
jgi:transposase-like protein